MDNLRFLIGDFAGSDTLHASPWTAAGTAAATSSGRQEISAQVLVQRHRDVLSGGTVFEVVNVLTRDPENDDLVLYSFDTAGFLPDPPARGTFVDDELVLYRRTPRGEARTCYAPTREGYRWSKQYRPTPDAPWQDLVTGSLRRRPSGPASGRESHLHGRDGQPG